MALNTDYGLRLPSRDEVRRAFGSLAACVRITGGDLPTILHYLANPERIKDAPQVAPQPGAFAETLIAEAQAEEAAEVWGELEKPSIVGVADRMGVCKQVARRALVTAGKWPKAVPA